MHYIENIETDTEWQTRFVDAHVDQHSISIHPQNPDLVISGNDGGVYRSTNRGLSHQKLDVILVLFQFFRSFYGCYRTNLMFK